jgi:dipeptidyl aminopeptidase/acylaminoacyl peptidase
MRPARCVCCLLFLGVLPGAAASPPAAASSAERSPSGPAAGPRPVTVDDLYALGWVSDLAIAPSGEFAVYAWTRPDRKTDAYTSRLHRLDLAKRPGASRALSPEGVAASQPRFSPDGRFLAWLESGERESRKSPPVALRIAPAGGGRAVTALALDEVPASFAWSPDGERLVLERLDAEPPGKPANAPWVITRTLARRDGEGFLDDRRTHLWLLERRSGMTKQLTFGPYDDSAPAWSPDGRQIAFVSNRSADPDATDDSDLYLVPAAGGEASLLLRMPGAESAPAWSHRGDRLAFHSLRRADDYYQPQRLMTIAVTGPPGPSFAIGEPHDLTGALDAWIASDCMPEGSSAAAPLWTADDSAILVLLEHRGATRVVSVAASEPAPGTSATPMAPMPPMAPIPPRVDELAAGRAVHGLLRTLPGGRGEIFSRTDPTHPPELFLRAPGEIEPRRLTHFYDSWLAGRTLVTPEKLVARNSAGDDVEAWLYPPLALASGRKAPLVVYIHGGPQGFDGDFFDFELENQLFAARGWAVLRVNYRGSTSYGERFSRAVWGDWQSREHEDLMAALDLAIATRDWIDADRLGIGGWSYGGILTLWTVAHTDRFKVGVPERFTFDYLSSFGEDQWFVWMLSELGSPLENEELYRRLSPATYVRQISTPLYLIANELDYNCPMSQALQLYQRLHLLGREAELVVYPDEPHSMSAPSHLADRLARLLVWFGRHLDT